MADNFNTSDDGSAFLAAELAELTYKIPYILAQSAVPVCLAPNGTVATNGVVTLGTALPTTYSGGIWLRLPANAIVGGLAGMYWAVMTSTTAGQVYTNFADPASEFIPYIPSGTLVAAVGSNAAYTQTTAEVTLINITLPANALGTSGALDVEIIAGNNNSAGAKTTRTRFGGQNMFNFQTTTNIAFVGMKWLQNTGVANRQVIHDSSALNAVSSVIPAYIAIDTTAAVAVTITGQIAVATDLDVVFGTRLGVSPS